MILKVTNRKGRVFKLLFDEKDRSLVESLHIRMSKKAEGLYYAQGFRRGDTTKNTELVHRIIVGAKKGEVVDHINGDTLDNRSSNLRICTQAENLKNRRKKASGSSKFKGVDWVKKDKTWRARVGHKCVGYFKDELSAAKAYNLAAKKEYGEFAKLNILGGENV